MYSTTVGTALPHEPRPKWEVSPTNGCQWWQALANAPGRGRRGKAPARFLHSQFTTTSSATPRQATPCFLVVVATLAVASAAFTQVQAPPRDLGAMSSEELMTIQVESLYAASRRTQKVTEAPASITIVTIVHGF